MLREKVLMALAENPNEVLIDHTMLQSLCKRPRDRTQIELRTRELLQLIEHLLLKDVIWISNLVTGPAEDTSESLLSQFQQFGLTDNRNEGIIRKTAFSSKQHKTAIEGAASEILLTTGKMKIQDLRNCIENTQYELRPIIGTAPLRYHSLLNIAYNSNEAHQLIEKGLESCDWEANVSPAFFNKGLYEWLMEIHKHASGHADKAYAQYNTVVRWGINSKLCEQLSKPNRKPVLYSPAFGRGLSLQRQFDFSFNRFQQLLFDRVIRRLQSADELKNLILSLNPYTVTDIPLFGMWALLKLPENCSLENLLEKIIVLRDHEYIVETRKLVNDGNSKETDSICDTVYREVSCIGSKSLGGGKSQMRGTTKLAIKWLPLGILELKTEYKLAEINRFVSQFSKKRRHTAILTGFINDVVNEPNIYRSVLTRAENLLNG
jgi:hypothetical protein